jgi:hypothetical protein
MSDDLLTLSRQRIRGTDSNSLLRLHDRTSGILGGSPSQADRARVNKVRDRIATELKKRGVSL